MKKVAVDYKGKHFVLMDEDTFDDDDIVDPYVSTENILANLEAHVADSLYYGIPAYIGADEELHKRIEEIYKKLV